MKSIYIYTLHIKLNKYMKKKGHLLNISYKNESF